MTLARLDTHLKRHLQVTPLLPNVYRGLLHLVSHVKGYFISST